MLLAPTINSAKMIQLFLNGSMPIDYHNVLINQPLESSYSLRPQILNSQT